MTTGRAENNRKKKNRRKTKHEHKMGLQMGWTRKGGGGGGEEVRIWGQGPQHGLEQALSSSWQYGSGGEKRDLHDL